MTRTPLALGQKIGKAKAPAASIESLTNGYLESVPEGKEPTQILGAPGLRRLSSGLDGNCRGWMEMSGAAYVVAGTKLYRVAYDGQATVLGTLPGLDIVSMDGDGTNVVIVTSGQIYVWNGTTVGLVTDPDAPQASDVVWIDGYFLFSELNSQQFFISELNDPTAFDALDFSSAEWKPDKLVASAVVRRTVFLMGEKTIEAQQNTGGADFPFARYSDIFIDVGLEGRDAKVCTNGTVYWLAHDRTARRLDGLTPAVISTAPVERVFRSWSNPKATICSSYTRENHLFVVFRNPEGCVVFDQTTERWHFRKSYGSDTWRAAGLLNAYGMDLAFSVDEPLIYELDGETNDEDGHTLELEIVTPWAWAKGNDFSTDELEVILQAGVGTLTLDPAITCELTTDGETWGSKQIRRIGKSGQRSRRVTFGPQGSADQMAWRFRITDPVPRCILGVYAEVDVEQ